MLPAPSQHLKNSTLFMQRTWKLSPMLLLHPGYISVNTVRLLSVFLCESVQPVHTVVSGPECHSKTSQDSTKE